MTERERREKGLPLNPERLAAYEHIQKDAEAKTQIMAEMISPVISRLQERITGLAASIDHNQMWRRMHQNISPVFELASRAAAAQKEREEFFANIWKSPVIDKSVVMRRPEVSNAPRRVTIDQEQFDMLITKLNERPAMQNDVIELMYDWQEKGFYRFALGQKLSSSFTDRRDNKRRQLTEKLLSARGYISTKKLMSSLRCSAKQIGNMITAVNDKVGADLTLRTEPLIDSKRGSGYRINPAYLVHQKK